MTLTNFELSQKNYFSLEIEKLKTHDMSYTDACILWCELNDIHISDIPKYINETLKEKIENEAIKNNLMKKKKSTTDLSTWLR